MERLFYLVVLLPSELVKLGEMRKKVTNFSLLKSTLTLSSKTFLQIYLLYCFEIKIIV